MDAGDALTMVGTNVSAVSVIIVFHMFAIQSWFTRVDAARSDAVRLSLTTGPDDMERENMRLQLNALSSSFPWIQVAILGFAVGSMAVAGTVVAQRAAHGFPVVAAIFPLLALVAVFVTSSVVTYRKGIGMVRNARDHLGSPG
jgi:hypothetical protein